MFIPVGSTVELRADEFAMFFSQYADFSSLSLYEKPSDYTLGNTDGNMVGDVTAITNDDRFVVGVDIPATIDLYTDQVRTVAVTHVDEGKNTYDLVITS